jgi:hypothetical protein
MNASFISSISVLLLLANVCRPYQQLQPLFNSNARRRLSKTAIWSTQDLAQGPLSPPSTTTSTRPTTQEYKRDARDTRPVDEAAVHTLIDQRLEAKHACNFARVLQCETDLLQQHGVKFYDACLMWSTDKTPPSQYFVHKNRNWFKHGYQQVGGELDPVTCSLCMQDIHMLIAKRERLRAMSNFGDAEAMLFELSIRGVALHDNPPMWRADGMADFDRTEFSGAPKTLTYKQVGDAASGDLPAGARINIEKLVQKRAGAIARNDQNRVRSMAFELYQTYGVMVDDRRRIWKMGQGFDEPWTKPELNFARTQPYRSATSPLLPIVFTETALIPVTQYTMSPFSKRMHDPPTIARIEEIVDERACFREMGIFKASDALRNELWKSYLVGVNDSLRQWSVAGVFGDKELVNEVEGPTTPEDVPVARKAFESRPAGRKPKSNLAPRSIPFFGLFQESKLSDRLDVEDLSAIENLVRYMQSHQLSNPNIVDRLMTRLDKEYGINFNGVMWTLGSVDDTTVTDYSPRDSNEDSPDAKIRQIKQMVRMRNVASLKMNSQPNIR